MLHPSSSNFCINFWQKRAINYAVFIKVEIHYSMLQNWRNIPSIDKTICAAIIRFLSITLTSLIICYILQHFSVGSNDWCESRRKRKKNVTTVWKISVKIQKFKSSSKRLRKKPFITSNNWQTCERTPILSDTYIRKTPWTIETEIEQ